MKWRDVVKEYKKAFRVEFPEYEKGWKEKAENYLEQYRDKINTPYWGVFVEGIIEFMKAPMESYSYEEFSPLLRRWVKRVGIKMVKRFYKKLDKMLEKHEIVHESMVDDLVEEAARPSASEFFISLYLKTMSSQSF